MHTSTQAPTAASHDERHADPPINGYRDEAEPALMHRSLLDRPLSVDTASGVYLTLKSGRRILDACAGAAVAAIGHGNAEVTDAIIAQLSKVSYVHTMAYTTDSAEELADCLVKHRPFGLSKAFFVSSGSEATDSALKLARQYHVENGQPEKKRIVARRQAYHGNTIGAMSVSSNIPRKAPYEGALLLDNVSFVNPANAYRDQSDSESEEEYGQRLVEELDAEFQALGPETVSVFVAETVGGATPGCTTPPKGYFEGVRQVCDKYGILLFLDEVMCGSGRAGTFFAFEQEGNVRPDIVTLGKGLGGGYSPIAGVLIHSKIVDTLRRGTASFNNGHTYQAHPVSCAAALAVQRIMQRDNLVEQCAVKGAMLEALLRRTFQEAKFVGNIRGRGLFWALEFVEDRPSKRSFGPDLAFGLKVQEEAQRRGVAVYPGRDTVILSPPLTITVAEIEIAVSVLKLAYDAVEQSLRSRQTVFL